MATPAGDNVRDFPAPKTYGFLGTPKDGVIRNHNGILTPEALKEVFKEFGVPEASAEAAIWCRRTLYTPDTQIKVFPIDKTTCTPVQAVKDLAIETELLAIRPQQLVNLGAAGTEIPNGGLAGAWVYVLVENEVKLQYVYRKGSDLARTQYSESELEGIYLPRHHGHVLIVPKAVLAAS